MNRVIRIRKYTVEDFIDIRNEGGEVVITLFHGRLAPGVPGWTQEMKMTPDQAEEVARELIEHAKKVR